MLDEIVKLGRIAGTAMCATGALALSGLLVGIGVAALIGASLAAYLVHLVLGFLF